MVIKVLYGNLPIKLFNLPPLPEIAPNVHAWPRLLRVVAPGGRSVGFLEVNKAAAKEQGPSFSSVSLPTCFLKTNYSADVPVQGFGITKLAHLFKSPVTIDHATLPRARAWRPNRHPK